jgi:hypothetical protein
MHQCNVQDEKQEKNNWGYRRYASVEEMLSRRHADGRLHMRVELIVCIGACTYNCGITLQALVSNQLRCRPGRARAPSAYNCWRI